MVDALLRVIVAELDENARRSVVELARARAIAWIPLLEAPVDTTLHVLEIGGPGELVVVFAEPVGAPTELGFPLRLHP